MFTTFDATMLAIGGIASAIAIVVDIIRTSMPRRWEPMLVDRGRIIDSTPLGVLERRDRR